MNNHISIPRKLNQLIQQINSNCPAKSYLNMLSDNPSIFKNSKYLDLLIEDFYTLKSEPSLYAQIDEEIFLPNKMLVKSDRSSMLESVESRSPFLDLSFLSLRNKVDSKIPKNILKQQLKIFIPEYPINHKKEGFISPINLLIETGE